MTPDPELIAETRAWFKKAAHDLRMAELALRDDTAMTLAMSLKAIVSRKLQKRFLSIPQTPLCYWLSERFFELMAGHKLDDIRV